MLAAKPNWKIVREWEGETAFIIAGGTSVANQSLGLLVDRKVVVINSSYLVHPGAAFLFFGDARWWHDNRRRPELRAYKGKIVTCSQAAHGNLLLRLRRVSPPPGFCDTPDGVACSRTSLQGAMNFVAHLGANKIVLLGADMRRGDDGKTHHHRPHPWPNRAGNVCWDQQMEQLKMIVEPLQQRNIEVINTSPITRIPWWPIKPLEECI